MSKSLSRPVPPNAPATSDLSTNTHNNKTTTLQIVFPQEVHLLKAVKVTSKCSEGRVWAETRHKATTLDLPGRQSSELPLQTLKIHLHNAFSREQHLQHPNTQTLDKLLPTRAVFRLYLADPQTADILKQVQLTRQIKPKFTAAAVAKGHLDPQETMVQIQEELPARGKILPVLESKQATDNKFLSTFQTTTQTRADLQDLQQTPTSRLNPSQSSESKCSQKALSDPNPNLMCKMKRALQLCKKVRSLYFQEKAKTGKMIHERQKNSKINSDRVPRWLVSSRVTYSGTVLFTDKLKRAKSAKTLERCWTLTPKMESKV